MSEAPAHATLRENYANLLEKYKAIVEEKDNITKKSKLSLENHLRKEMDFRERLGVLKSQIDNPNDEEAEADIRMSTIRSLHKAIQASIGQIQGKTQQILKDQERDLLRAFRARLADVTEELNKERKKTESGSVEWVSRCRKLTEELEWLRELTERLTNVNKKYDLESKTCRRQLKTQEEDREFLIKQLVAVKKENARLRFSTEAKAIGPGMSSHMTFTSPGRAGLKLPSDLQRASPKLPSDLQLTSSESKRSPGLSSPLGSISLNCTGSLEKEERKDERGPARLFPDPTKGLPLTQLGEARYNEVISKLKKSLAQEQHRHRMILQALEADNLELHNPLADDLQKLFVRCIEDVKQDIGGRGARNRGGRTGRVRSALRTTPRVDPSALDLKDLTGADRINVMEWFFSQDVVIKLAFDEMFPASKLSTNTTGEADS